MIAARFSRHLRFRPLRLRLLAAGVAAVALVAVPMIPVGAATASTPSRVSSWFAHSALAVIRDTAAGATSLSAGTVDFASATSVGTPHRVDAWTAGFLSAKKKYSAATGHTTSWIAAVRASGTVIGTIVATDTAGAVSFASYDDQADLGRGLVSLASGSIVVHDAGLSSWVALKSSKVRPLTAMTAVDLPSSKSLAAYRAILVKRHASALSNSSGKAGAAGGGGPVIPVAQESPLDALTGWGGPALLLLGAAGVAVHLARRRRVKGRQLNNPLVE